MRLLIAQGPGYYGVNIRLIHETNAGVVKTAMLNLGGVKINPSDDKLVDVSLNMREEEEGVTTLILTHTLGNGEEVSTGFDTGWWAEGETAIEFVIRDARSIREAQMKAAGRRSSK
jgi:hypothetical protein